ncbi:Hypothetical predicted protein [Mytilus galloprovincialis]|uniref:Ankyrin repeat domain-containing protein n=1 Tax=Mytilus galloprovincialis TaxID=29158 RepID=A0A8B6FIP2_MYTGA|nr:Hypothetical predicted protein [Mytilus galloprovincialis]VDI49183.1 Hypothetical predicted protein [Mytilus galloprovincialis]
MANYPINVYTTVFKDDIVQQHQQIDDLGKSGQWSELIELLESSGELVNSSRLPVKGDNKGPTWYTPLHYAADLGAPEHIFKDLIRLGASKSMKNAEGQTAYDIAKSKGLDKVILDQLVIPKKIKQNAAAIEKMEKGLHEVINSRVKDLIKGNGQALPQLSLLFEHGSFYYPVPGMYGGFSVSEHEDGIQADSWIRVCGGSEQNHVVNKEGKVTLLPNDNPL